MARAMRHALEAGYWAAGAGRIAKRRYAHASSPVTGLIAGQTPSSARVAEPGIAGE
jgi:thiazole synthase ThiGH ThiG subunit